MKTETRDIVVKRLRMRSWRRGIKEMDLILGAFADQDLNDLSDADLALYGQLLNENDHDLYNWCSGQSVSPKIYDNLIEKIMSNSKEL